MAAVADPVIFDPSPAGQATARRALNARVLATRLRAGKTVKARQNQALSGLLGSTAMAYEGCVHPRMNAPKSEVGVLACEVTFPLLNSDGTLADCESYSKYRGTDENAFLYILKREVMVRIPSVLLRTGALAGRTDIPYVPGAGYFRAVLDWVCNLLLDDARARLARARIEGMSEDDLPAGWAMSNLDGHPSDYKLHGHHIVAAIDGLASPQVPVCVPPDARPSMQASPDPPADPQPNPLPAEAMPPAAPPGPVLPAPGFDVADAADEPVEPWDPTEGLSASEEEDEGEEMAVAAAPQAAPQAAVVPTVDPPADPKERHRARRQARELARLGGCGLEKHANGPFYGYASVEDLNCNHPLARELLASGRRLPARKVCKIGITGRDAPGVAMRAKEVSAQSGTCTMRPIFRICDAKGARMHPYATRQKRAFMERVEDAVCKDRRIAKFRESWTSGREWFVATEAEWTTAATEVWSEKLALFQEQRAAAFNPQQQQLTMHDFATA